MSGRSEGSRKSKKSKDSKKSNPFDPPDPLDPPVLPDSPPTRIAVIGIGSMGARHARMLASGKVHGAELAAICDPSEKTLAPFSAKKFHHYEDLLASPDVDAVLISTPHYTHTTIGIAALEAGKHVLVEKPISVHKADCEKLLAAHTNERLVFAAMFKMRADPCWKKIRDLVRSGALGAVRRIHWTATHWFRRDDYYRSGGGWRGTWSGEGGGVLLNQCPHQLDLWQWIFGMPDEVRADCSFGKYHPIEVEDEATAIMRYANGATGVFTASTGEYPGTNRLEIAAENGRLVCENGELKIEELGHREHRGTESTEEKCSERQSIEDGCESAEKNLCALCSSVSNDFQFSTFNFPLCSSAVQHQATLQNFVDAIREGTPLITPAREGLHSVELANAMILSTHLADWVRLPMDSSQYTVLLAGLVRS